MLTTLLMLLKNLLDKKKCIMKRRKSCWVLSKNSYVKLEIKTVILMIIL